MALGVPLGWGAPCTAAGAGLLTGPGAGTTAVRWLLFLSTAFPQSILAPTLFLAQANIF